MNATQLAMSTVDYHVRPLTAQSEIECLAKLTRLLRRAGSSDSEIRQMIEDIRQSICDGVKEQAYRVGYAEGSAEGYDAGYAEGMTQGQN